MGWLFTILVLAAAGVWLARRLRRPAADVEAAGGTQSVFRVVFRGGRAARVEGRIPRNALSGFEDIAAEADLDGEVTLTGLAELHFSDSIPPAVRQQLRNVYLASLSVH